VSKRTLFGVTFAALLLCLCARDASACSCAEFSTRQNLRRSGAVFLGKVVEMLPADPGGDFPPAEYVVRFEVERRWKGARGREVSALASTDWPGMCGDLKLEVGGRFLIYAERRKGRLFIYRDCGPSRPAKDAGEEMKKLDGLTLRADAPLNPYPKPRRRPGAAA
jgi:hypothetical protein